MFRIISLSIVLMGIIYFLPFFTGEKEFDDVSLFEIPILSEIPIEDIPDFSINELINSEKNENTQIISVLIDDTIIEIDIDEYLVGVVSAEMPALFEIEALKAQAIAARTYIYYKQHLIDLNLSDGVHIGAVVCNDHTHCKSYIDIANTNPWGDYYDDYFEKITQAVQETTGEIIVYEDEPIASVFHSVSSEKTESAVDVWGSDIPYLVSVESFGSENSAKYYEQKSFLFDDFKKKILKENSNATFSEDPKTWFFNSTRSDTGGIIEVYVGGVVFKGTKLREIFELNSTNFTVTYDEEYITFNTTGYGHGVGMSQYGANELAKNGSSYEEILQWYYTDTKIIEK